MKPKGSGPSLETLPLDRHGKILAGEEPDPKEDKPEEYRIEIANEKVREARLRNDEKEEDISYRRELVRKIYEKSWCWLLFLAAILIIQGYKNPLSEAYYFKLPESTLNVLLGTTTTTILGLYFIVVRHFFSRNRD